MLTLSSARIHLLRRVSLLAALTAAAAICAVRPASADPLRITGGNLNSAAPWTGYDPPFGFELTGEQTSLGGITFTLTGLGFYNVGDVIDLSGAFSISANPYRTGPFGQTVDGVRYDEVFLDGTVRLTAAPVALTNPDAPWIEAPFTMDGSISLFRGDPANIFQPGDPLGMFRIAGNGTASLSLVPRGDLIAGSFVTYSFAAAPPSATPEPGTLLLLGSGVAMTVNAVRRRKSRMQP